MLVYTDAELKKKIYKMIEDFESEVVEFKEAASNFSFNDIGKYFSALGNEANIRGLNERLLGIRQLMLDRRDWMKKYVCSLFCLH